MIQQLLPSGYYIFLPTFLSLAEYLHKQQMNIKVKALIFYCSESQNIQWGPKMLARIGKKKAPNIR